MMNRVTKTVVGSNCIVKIIINCVAKIAQSYFQKGVTRMTLCHLPRVFLDFSFMTLL